MTRSTGAHRPRGSVAQGAQRGFRPDIQGLRAIAVSLVVVYHLYPSLLPGGFVGVDVFFVISGFLITGHLMRTLERTGRVGFLEFYGRRARRLMPAAVLVLAVVWLASRVILPVTQLAAAAQQVRASALYYQNWVLAHDAVNYLDANAAPSPVQHFWSLSVEEQFYVGWPLLFLLAAGAGLLVTRRVQAGGGTPDAVAAQRVRVCRAVLLTLALSVVAVSLWFSIHETRVNPAGAYFVTTTRVWELAAGGALALLPRAVAERLGRVGILAWAGLVAVIAAVFVIDGSTAFPGSAALLPVGGAMLLIASGSAAARQGPARLMSVRPMVFLGDISYSLYLWHWPVIVLWKAYSGRSIGLLDGPVIAAVSIVLAWVTKVLVEDRVRLATFFSRHSWRSLATITAVSVPVALTTAFLSSQPSLPTSRPDAAHQGARALAGPPAPAGRAVPLPPTSTSTSTSTTTTTSTTTSTTTTTTTAPLSPPLTVASKDYEIASSGRCQTPGSETEIKHCIIGDTLDPLRHIALVGDSVAGMWSSALDDIGKRLRWRIDVITHSGCPWSSTVMVQQSTDYPDTACHTWGVKLLSTLRREKPDVVITSDRATLGIESHFLPDAHTRAVIGAGMATYWKDLAAIGTDVVGIVEGPEMSADVPDCLAARGSSVTKCSTPTSVAILPTSPVRYAGQKASDAHVVDMNSLLCTPTVCSPVIGNVIVYRDAHHLTKTYSMTLVPYLEQKLLDTGAFGDSAH